MNFSKQQYRYILIGVIALAVAFRLLRIFHPHDFLSGDEAILAYLAAQWPSLEAIYFFYPGQAYGLAFLEILAIWPFQFLLGPCDIAVRLPMLLLFLLSAFLWYRALANRINPTMALYFTALYLSLPSWFYFGMQARGGYVSGLLICALAAFLLSRSKLPYWRELAISFCLALIPLSAPVLLAFPIFLLAFFTPTKASLIRISGWTLLLFTLLFLWRSGLDSFWNPSLELAWHESPRPLILHLLTAFSGFYWLGDAYLHQSHHIVLSALALLLILPMSFWAIRRSEVHWLRTSAYCLALLISLLLPTLFEGLPLRYFLGFTLLLLFGLLYTPQQRLVALGLPLIFLTLSIYLIQPKLFRYNPTYTDFELSTKRLIKDLDQRQIRAVYSLDPLLTYNLLYYSEGTIQARWVNPEDRLPDIPAEVDQMWYANPQHTAFVAYLPYGPAEEAVAKDSTAFVVDGLYFVQQAPGQELLDRWGFELNARSSTP